ncbi:MAG TPA: hypothetical protein VMW12_01380 [Candidatus Dormibacteraeota bacterium]|nr:hypothetical protein [Candidatus Dormibacteraeota bacterium]
MHALVVAVVLVCTVAASAAAPKIALRLVGRIVSMHDGKVRYEPMDRPVKAGELLQYTIDATNAGSAPAFSVAPIGRVPDRTAFVKIDGASRASEVAYTVDGSHWSVHPTIAVREANGKTVMKPAPLSSYRAVRWTLKQPLPVRGVATFSYEVRVQ